MGGRAFNNLYCPRISRELYLEAREQTTDALSKLFKHVVVPTEMPSKTDYGDIDFLASGFFHTPTASALNWPAMVSAIKAGFKTIHGRQGFFNKSVMYFAIPAPGREDEFWIQVDVKVCDFPDKQTFEWARFQLNYASGAKIIGSIIKPLGLTISPEGLHLRVQEIEDTNFPGSMVFVSKEPLDALQIVGLDRRILRAGFRSNEESMFRLFLLTTRPTRRANGLQFMSISLCRGFLTLHTSPNAWETTSISIISKTDQRRGCISLRSGSRKSILIIASRIKLLPLRNGTGT